MTRPVKHFSLHRIAGAELRVVSDVEAGVLPLIEAEEAVIRGYTQHGPWPHRWVTFLILQDLQPLIRQLKPEVDLPPGGVNALNLRPVINVYDISNLEGCNVFLNHQAMEKEGYLGDATAVRGLLAHEHAHPLSENETTRASRALRLSLAVESIPGLAGSSGATGVSPDEADRHRRIMGLMALLGEKLCLYAPREVFANETAIRSGFADCLHHLDRRCVCSAQTSVAGREDLQRVLREQAAAGAISREESELLMLIGDLKGYVDLAMEVAAFYRAGREADAQGLEAGLLTGVFDHLDDQVLPVYTALRDQYMALTAEMTADELAHWGDDVLQTLTEAVARKGLLLQYQLRAADS